VTLENLAVVAPPAQSANDDPTLCILNSIDVTVRDCCFGRAKGDIFLGERAASFLNAKVGERLAIGRGEFRVGGVFRTSNGFEDGGVFLPLADAQDFFHREGLVSLVAVKLSDPSRGLEFKRAVEECEKAMALDPEHFMPHFILGRAYMRMGDHARAIAQLKLAKVGDVPLMDAALGLAYAVSGRKDQTQKMAETFKTAAKKRYIPPTYFGMLCAGLGDKDKALEWLEKAFQERADGLTWLNVEPMLDELRFDPRFRNLVDRIGLTK